MQFGLACTYLHRTGLTVRGVTLFRKIDTMSNLLPRTHGLMKKGVRVNSITRNETLIKNLINKALLKKKALGTFIFPDF